jgi:type 1 glutamine amidotransferase
VFATQDPAVFNTLDLHLYDIVVWFNTTGNALDSGQESAFLAYTESAGGYVGIHCAADTGYAWPFYSELVGVYFESDPAIQQATIRVEDAAHPATASFPAAWAHTEDWYNFRTKPRGNVRVLASLNEQTYSGGTVGGDRPIVRSHDQGAGRAFCAELGRTPETYSEPLFLEMLAEAIGWVGGVSPLRK